MRTRDGKECVPKHSAFLGLLRAGDESGVTLCLCDIARIAPSQTSFDSPLSGVETPSLPIDSSFCISAVLSHTRDRVEDQAKGGSGLRKRHSGQWGIELWRQEYFRGKWTRKTWVSKPPFLIFLAQGPGNLKTRTQISALPSQPSFRATRCHCWSRLWSEQTSLLPTPPCCNNGW